MTDVRRVIRYIVNVVSILLTVAALPDFISIVPPSTIAWIASITPAINVVLSWLRPLAAPGK